MPTQSPSRSTVVGYDDAPRSVDVPAPVHIDRDIRRIGVAYDGSPEADGALRAAESLASDLGAALTVYCLVGSTSIPVGDGTRTETQLQLGVPQEELACRAYGVVDLLFVHNALLDNASGELARAAGCPVVVS
jgi:hypothetical protein